MGNINVFQGLEEEKATLMTSKANSLWCLRAAAKSVWCCLKLCYASFHVGHSLWNNWVVTWPYNLDSVQHRDPSPQKSARPFSVYAEACCMLMEKHRGSGSYSWPFLWHYCLWNTTNSSTISGYLSASNNEMKSPALESIIS